MKSSTKSKTEVSQQTINNLTVISLTISIFMVASTLLSTVITTMHNIPNQHNIVYHIGIVCFMLLSILLSKRWYKDLS